MAVNPNRIFIDLPPNGPPVEGKTYEAGQGTDSRVSLTRLHTTKAKRQAMSAETDCPVLNAHSGADSLTAPSRNPPYLPEINQQRPLKLSPLRPGKPKGGPADQMSSYFYRVADRCVGGEESLG
jgi:hypothetical protein